MNSLRIAWQNILRNRRRSLVTILIAAVGTAATLIAGGFADYTYDALRDSAARETGHLILAHRNYFDKDEETPLQFGLDDYAAMIGHLEKHPQVRRVLPRLAFSGLVSNGDKTMIFVGQGVDVGGELAARGVFLKLLEGRLWRNEDGSSPRVLLGADLAKSLGARPGSGLTLLGSTADGGLNALDVEVAGIVSSGVPDVDKRLVLAGLPTAQRLLATKKISTLSVHLDAAGLTSSMRDRLQADYPQLAVQTWRQQAFYYESVRGLYNRIFGLLGLIIAALVLFSVGNTLAMAVVERTREIGTLRALGALPGEIVAQFVREGGMIGALGALIGMAMAGACTLTLLLFPVQMPPPPGRSDGYPLMVNASPILYAFVTVIIVLLCVAAAWFVSRNASRTPIVEALGHV